MYRRGGTHDSWRSGARVAGGAIRAARAPRRCGPAGAFRRRAARRRRLGGGLQQEGRRMADPDLAEAAEERDTVRAALRRLPEGDREILLLVAWEELTPSEAAKVMATSALVARTRLHRARRRL